MNATDRAVIAGDNALALLAAGTILADGADLMDEPVLAPAAALVRAVIVATEDSDLLSVETAKGRTVIDVGLVQMWEGDALLLAEIRLEMRGAVVQALPDGAFMVDGMHLRVSPIADRRLQAVA